MASRDDPLRRGINPAQVTRSDALKRRQVPGPVIEAVIDSGPGYMLYNKGRVLGRQYMLPA